MFGLVIGLTTILGGVYLALLDKPVAGLGTIIATVAGLVGVFVYGKYTQRKELDRKKFSPERATYRNRVE